jgi:hypothetical protein
MKSKEIYVLQKGKIYSFNLNLAKNSNRFKHSRYAEITVDCIMHQVEVVPHNYSKEDEGSQGQVEDSKIVENSDDLQDGFGEA